MSDHSYSDSEKQAIQDHLTARVRSQLNAYSAGASYDEHASTLSDPTSYEVRDTVNAEIAGRNVLLKLKPADDLTMRETLDICLLLQAKVTRNKMAFIIDRGLIRHFVEIPIVDTRRHQTNLMIESAQRREAMLADQNLVLTLEKP